ncbi:MAG: hypothetical protein AB8B59_17455 [Maribacter sp.]
MTNHCSKLSKSLFIFILTLCAFSCSKNSVNSDDLDAKTNPDDTACINPLNTIYNEKDGLVLVEFESAEFSENWKLKNDGNSFSGDGYMVWEGSQHLGNPGNGTVTFKINITNAGTYQFLWNSAIKTGTSGTDHNDTWLRFGDADDFYGQNVSGTSTVYPKGTGKTPNPGGASAEGWFKIYRSGNDLDFKWQSSTFDNNGHNVFVQFDTPGNYLMEVSARSSGHGIDKFILFNDSVTQADAISSSENSIISCN